MDREHMGRAGMGMELGRRQGSRERRGPRSKVLSKTLQEFWTLNREFVVSDTNNGISRVLSKCSGFSGCKPHTLDSHLFFFLFFLMPVPEFQPAKASLFSSEPAFP